MKKLKFPIANISSKKWDCDENVYILDSEYIYTTNEMFYSRYFLNNSFVDSNGKVFTITDRLLPNRVRQILSFIPNICKVELVFKETGKKMTIEEIRSHIIRQVEEIVDDNELRSEWIKKVKNAKTIEDVISG